MPVSPPELFSLEAERALLGCILIDPDALHEVADRVMPDDFHQASHRAVYRAMRSLDAGDVALDIVTLAEALRRADAPEPAGGWEAYLISLLNAVPTSLNIAGYARIVGDHARRRSLIRAAGHMAKLAYDMDLPGERATGQAVEAVLELQQGHESGKVLSPQEYARDFLDELDSEDERDVIPTPWVGLNELLLGGLARPFCYVLAARPKVGKSALALQIAGHAALRLRKRVYLATTEMSSRQFTRRIIAQQTGIPAARLEARNLSPSEREQAMYAAARLSESGLYLDVSAGLTSAQVRARAMRLAARGGLDLMVVDHLHEMAADAPMAQRHLELGAMARSLRDTAKQLNVPLLLVAQLSRSTEHRADKRPQLSDLREAGAIEEVAYAVMFLYRESYYNDLLQPGSDDPTELIVAAHRDGPTGTVNLFWNGPLMRSTEQGAPVPASSNGKQARLPHQE